MAKKVIEAWVDWGKSFVDRNGSFYCGTTEEQKDTAVRVSVGEEPVLRIYFCDVHPRTSSEFSVNGGFYQTHNLPKSHEYDLQKLGVADGLTVSPQLTEKLYDMIKDKKSGLIVPRHVFFQDYNGGEPKPAFMYEDVEETFGAKKLDPEELLDGSLEYVVNAKHMFNGALVQPSPAGTFDGIPDNEENSLSILKRKYGQGEDLTFKVTGVVGGICDYQTSSGIRQVFPKSEIYLIADGITHLLVPELGLADVDTAELVLKKMCQQIGIRYVRSDEYLGRKGD